MLALLVVIVILARLFTEAFRKVPVAESFDPGLPITTPVLI